MANNVSQLYKSVINDVVGQVREAFLDEGVDPDVLTQLRQDWEAKVLASGCVDLEGAPRAMNPLALGSIPQYKGGPMGGVPIARVQQPVSAGAAATNMVLPRSGAIAFAPQPIHPSQQTSVFIMANNPQQQQIQHGKLRPGSGARLMYPKLPTKLEQQQTHQIDGAAAVPGTSKRTAQLDGAGGISDDSDSDDDLDEDKVDKIVEKVNEDEDEENAEGVAEEDPLNSGDDQSDDEDVDTLFDADNVVMCQFEKITRVRNKWKFVLKDGIMHIGKKDFAFQKATGEAEW